MFTDHKKTARRKQPRAKRRPAEEVYAALDAMLREGKEINLRTLRERLGGGSFTTLFARIDEWKQARFRKLTGDVPVAGDVMVDEVLIDSRVESPTRHVVYQAGVAMELANSELQGLGRLPPHVDTETMPGMYIVSVKPVAPVKLVMTPHQFADFQLRVMHGNMLRQRQNPPEDLDASDHAVED